MADSGDTTLTKEQIDAMIAGPLSGIQAEALEVIRQYNATLQKRVEELEKDNATLIQCRQELLGVGVRAREALVEITRRMEEEKALLDWYEANPNSVIFSSGYRGEKGSWSYRDSGKFSTDALTLRDAIRAAHNAAKEQA